MKIECPEVGDCLVYDSHYFPFNGGTVLEVQDINAPTPVPFFRRLICNEVDKSPIRTQIIKWGELEEKVKSNNVKILKKEEIETLQIEPGDLFAPIVPSKNFPKPGLVKRVGSGPKTGQVVLLFNNQYQVETSILYLSILVAAGKIAYLRVKTI